MLKSVARSVLGRKATPEPFGIARFECGSFGLSEEPIGAVVVVYPSEGIHPCVYISENLSTAHHRQSGAPLLPLGERERELRRDPRAEAGGGCPEPLS